jgi:branched-chain amino acid transport system permease protein
MTVFFQQLVFGLLVGGMYGLAATGLSLIFGVLRLLNVAHGELIMLGGYATFWLFESAGVDPFASLLLTFPLLFLAGLALYRGLFGLLGDAPEEAKIRTSLLIGFGLALALDNLAIRLWTADERAVAPAYAGVVWRAFGVALPLVRLSAVAMALGLVAGLHLLLSRTFLGRAIRATAEDREAAALAGIDVDRVSRVSFALGTACAGAAGTLVSVGYSISPAIGLEWTLKALIVIILAGLGSLFGTFASGLLLGVAESTSTLVLGGAYREVVGLAIFLAVLMARPHGLFGR